MGRGETIVANESKVEFKRHITLLNAIGLVVGTIIGSGIFVSPKGVYEYSGHSAGLSVLIWIFCGLFSMLGSLCYAELGTTITRSGGDYAYIFDCFGPFLAYLYLWVSILVIRPTTQAITALTFAFYALSPIGSDCGAPDLSVKLIAAACLCFLTVVNCLSVNWSMKIQDGFTIAKLLALLLIISIGFYLLFKGETQDAKEFFEQSEDAKQHISLAIYSGLFAFGGWNYINFVTEELQNPYKNLPFAAILGILVVTVVYVLTNISYFIALAPSEILSSSATASVFIEKTCNKLTWIIPIAVAFSTFGGLNGTLFSTARLICSGALEMQLPALFGMISTSKATPTPALILSCMLSVFMLITSNVYELINYFSFTLWLWTGITTTGLVVLRLRHPKLLRPLKFPIALPVIFSLSCFILTAFAVWDKPVNALIGIIVIILGVPFYYLQSKKSLTHCADSWSNLCQKLLLVSTPEGRDKMSLL